MNIPGGIGQAGEQGVISCTHEQLQALSTARTDAWPTDRFVSDKSK
ncbi:hypothetical protein RWE15_09875 [Virgibacillus halophilus]|uniref:Uncharacterized protein n=1 Tax=Tigheibacillus halophilus TaxID=361280 RepID=A0ABU5C5V0_9BACI|nr:hypothetical protein [Virgibacillus halophilus]